MIYSSLAMKYAKALFEVSKESKTLEDVKNSLSEILDAIENDKEIIEILNSPLLSHSRKLEFIRALKDVVDVHPLVFNLIGLLVEKGRVYLLNTIIRTFNELYMEDKGIRVVYVKTARSMENEEKIGLRERLKSILGGEVELQVEVAPELIGGIILRYKDFMIDGSIRKILSEIRDAITSL